MWHCLVNLVAVPNSLVLIISVVVSTVGIRDIGLSLDCNNVRIVIVKHEPRRLFSSVVDKIPGKLSYRFGRVLLDKSPGCFVDPEARCLALSINGDLVGSFVENGYVASH